MIRKMAIYILILSLLVISPLIAEKPPTISEEGDVEIYDVEENRLDTTEADSTDSSYNESLVKKGNTTNPFSLLAHLFLNLYQKFVTTQDNQSCQFRPSCSSFSKKAFSSHDPLKATLMTSDRLLRCNPAAQLHYSENDSGYLIDPVKEHALW